MKLGCGRQFLGSIPQAPSGSTRVFAKHPASSTSALTSERTLGRLPEGRFSSASGPSQRPQEGVGSWSPRCDAASKFPRRCLGRHRGARRGACAIGRRTLPASWRRRWPDNQKETTRDDVTPDGSEFEKATVTWVLHPASPPFRVSDSVQEAIKKGHRNLKKLSVFSIFPVAGCRLHNTAKWQSLRVGRIAVFISNHPYCSSV